MMKYFQVVKLNKNFHIDMKKLMLLNVMNHGIVCIQQQLSLLVGTKFIQMIQKLLMIRLISFLKLNMINMEKHLQEKHVPVFN